MVAGGSTPYRESYPEYKLEELCMVAHKMLLEDNDLKAPPLEVKGFEVVLHSWTVWQPS